MVSMRSIPQFFEQGQHVVRDVQTRADDAIHNRPLTSVSSAFAFGMVIGILLTMACPAAFPGLFERR